MSIENSFNKPLQNNNEKKPEKLEIKKIEKIHFLIHPGYVKNPNYSIPLSSKYINKAENLRENEIMIAFAPTTKFKRDIKKEESYTKTLKKLKEILGDRLIIFTGYSFVDDENSAKVFLENAVKIAKARGYYFDSNVESEAYGELLRDCVVRGADTLNRAGKFEQKTIVKTDITDVSMRRKKERETAIKRIKSGDIRRFGDSPDSPKPDLKNVEIE